MEVSLGALFEVRLEARFFAADFLSEVCDFFLIFFTGEETSSASKTRFALSSWQPVGFARDFSSI